MQAPLAPRIDPQCLYMSILLKEIAKHSSGFDKFPRLGARQLEAIKQPSLSPWPTALDVENYHFIPQMNYPLGRFPDTSFSLQFSFCLGWWFLLGPESHSVLRWQLKFRRGMTCPISLEEIVEDLGLSLESVDGLNALVELRSQWVGSCTRPKGRFFIDTDPTDWSQVGKSIN